MKPILLKHEISEVEVHPGTEEINITHYERETMAVATLIDMDEESRVATIRKRKKNILS